MKFNRIIKMLKSGELFFKIREKLSVIFLKNIIIKNKQLEYREYRRLKRKYSNIIKNQYNDTVMKPSNKVWIFWFQGEKNAPDLVKSCIKSIRSNFKNKEVIVLDEKNYKKYVTFPKYIEEKFKKGIIPYAHFSDLIRIELLAKHGGTWCDATLFSTSQPPKIMTDSELFVFRTLPLDRNDEELIVSSNWYMSAYSNNKIILTTRDLLFEYWKRERFLTHYFIFHIFFKMVTDYYKEEWEKVPIFNNVSPHTLQFELLNKFNKERFEQIKGMSPVHKLSRHLENKNKNTFYNYIENCK